MCYYSHKCLNYRVWEILVMGLLKSHLIHHIIHRLLLRLKQETWKQHLNSKSQSEIISAAITTVFPSRFRFPLSHWATAGAGGELLKSDSCPSHLPSLKKKSVLSTNCERSSQLLRKLYKIADINQIRTKLKDLNKSSLVWMFRPEALGGQGGGKHPHWIEQWYRTGYFWSRGHPQTCKKWLDMGISLCSGCDWSHGPACAHTKKDAE